MFASKLPDGLTASLSVFSSLVSIAFLCVTLFDASIAKAGPGGDRYRWGGLRSCVCRDDNSFNCGGMECMDTTSYADTDAYKKIILAMQSGLFVMFILSIVTMFMNCLNIYYRHRSLFLWSASINLLSVVGGIVATVFAAIWVKLYLGEKGNYSYGFTLLIIGWINNLIAATLLIHRYRKSPSSALPSSASDAVDQEDGTCCITCTKTNPMKLLKIAGVLELIIFILGIASLSDPSIGLSSMNSYSTSTDSSGPFIDGALPIVIGYYSNHIGLFRFCVKGINDIYYDGKYRSEICEHYKPGDVMDSNFQAAQAFSILSVAFTAFIGIIIGGYFYSPSFRSSTVFLHSVIISGFITVLWYLLLVAMLIEIVVDYRYTPGAAFGLFCAEFLMQIIAVLLIYSAYKQLLKQSISDNEGLPVMNKGAAPLNYSDAIAYGANNNNKNNNNDNHNNNDNTTALTSINLS